MAFILKYRISWLLSVSLFLMAVLFTTASCSDEKEGAEGAVVSLSCKPYYADSVVTRSSGNRAATRAITTATENVVEDLTVYIFDGSGNVIGNNYSSYSDSPDGITMSIMTRAAKGCTIYAIANAGSGTFSGVNTQSDFDEKYASIASASALENGSNYAIMFGKMKVDIVPGANKLGTLDLARLLSKITFKIVPKNTDTNFPITVTGYQLCHVPLECYYSDSHDASSTKLTSYGNFDQVAPQENNTDGSTLTFTYYVYENLAGSNAASTSWKLRNKSNSPANASYLVVNASTAIWKSTYYIYLGGKMLTASDTGGSGSTYDYTDYNIYRNTNYTVTVNINGSGADEDDVRVDYDANIYFSTPGISAWIPTSIDVDM